MKHYYLLRRSVIFLLSLFFLASFSFAASNSENGQTKATPNAGKNYKEGELIVKFKSGVPESARDKIHIKYGAQRIKEFPGLRMHHIKLKKGMSVEEAVAYYQADPAVEYAEPNFLVSALAVPNDPSFPQLWGLYNTGQTGGTPGADIQATAAWDITTGSSNVVVAVIDTGVDYTHPDLSANMWVNTGEIAGNGIDDDRDGYVDDVYGINVVNGSGDPLDDFGHGTHCAGTIGAAGNNNMGVAGVNWKVKIMACKFLDSSGYGTDAGAIACLEYVRAMKSKGVNIVATSNSWGGSGYAQALYDAINAQRDILFIAAAGNNGCNTDLIPNYPSGYYLPNIVSVMATDHNDDIALWPLQPYGCAPGSNYGRRSVDVGAPGLNILSTFPGNSYQTMSGTSMATPHVSGLAALIKSWNPDMDWIGIKNLILAGGKNIPSMSGTAVTGKRINAYGSLTCTDSPLFSALLVPPITVGTPVTLSALSINCASGVGPVTVTTSAGETVTLHDDGVAPDLAAGDGVYSATTIFTQNYSYLTFSSPAGTDPFVITTALLPKGSVGSSYNQTLQASGGVPPYTWVIVSGNLPDGLTLNSSTGVISGTPKTANTYNFTVQATDSQSKTASKAFLITISVPLPDLIITAVSCPATAAKGEQITMNATVKNQGAADAGTFQVGFYLSIDPHIDIFGDYFQGYLSIASLAAGAEQNVSIPVTVSNVPVGIYYCGAAADLFNSLTEADETNNTLVGNQITITAPQPDLMLTSITATPTAVKTGDAVTVTAVVKNQGQADAGASTMRVYLSPDTTIDGSDTFVVDIPTSTLAAGASTTVTGTFTVPAINNGRYYVGGYADIANQVPESNETNNALAGTPINIYSPLAITTNSLVSGVLGSGYNQTLTATGGLAPYVWSVVSGSLPPGLTLNSSTGVITGTPTATGTFCFTVQVSDANSWTTTKQLCITIYAPLAITTNSLLSGTIGIAYIQTLSATGGLTPYTWAIAPGSSLPPGLTLSSTGVISGTPTSVGTYNFTVQVTDSLGLVATTTPPLTIVILPRVAQLNAWTNIYSASPRNTKASNLSVGSFAVGGGTNRLLLVSVVMEIGSNANPTVSATYGGTALTQIRITANTQREIVWTGYLNDAQIGSGSKPLTISYSGASGKVSALHVKWASYSGVNQITPVASSGATNTATTSATFGSTINYVNNGMTVVVAGNGGTPATGTLTATPSFIADTATTTNAQTSRTFTATHTAGGGSYASSTAVTWSGTTSPWSGLVVVSLQP